MKLLGKEGVFEWVNRRGQRELRVKIPPLLNSSLDALEEKFHLSPGQKNKSKKKPIVKARGKRPKGRGNHRRQH